MDGTGRGAEEAGQFHDAKGPSRARIVSCK